jgi:UDPglucose 6-dehydrogenase
MKELMKDTVVFDGRNLFDTKEMTDRGFYYQSIGRKTIQG